MFYLIRIFKHIKIGESMGKSERPISDEFEICLTAKLNNEQFITENVDRNHIDLTANFISNHYKNILNATWTGYQFNNIGDIAISKTDNTTHYIEVKYVKGGRGTSANISQDGLTGYNIFKAMPWSLFREKQNQYENTIKIINNYEQVEFNSYDEFVCYCRNKREDLNFGPILKSIKKYANEEKKNYKQYLQNSEINYSELKLFIKNLFYRRNSEKTYIYDFNKFEKNFDVFYINRNTGEVILENNQKDFDFIDDENSEAFVSFVPKTAYIIIGLLNKITQTKRNFYKICFNWKNVGQGIASPCLHVFDCRNKQWN